jgi:hypothetical protein
MTPHVSLEMGGWPELALALFVARRFWRTPLPGLVVALITTTVPLKLESARVLLSATALGVEA